MTVNQYAHYQDSGSNSSEWNAVIFNVFKNNCAFPAVASQNVCCETPAESELRPCHIVERRGGGRVRFSYLVLMDPDVDQQSIWCGVKSRV